MPTKLNAQQVFPTSVTVPKNGEPINAGGIWANDGQTGFTGTSDALAYLTALVLGPAFGYSVSFR